MKMKTALKTVAVTLILVAAFSAGPVLAQDVFTDDFLVQQSEAPPGQAGFENRAFPGRGPQGGRQPGQFAGEGGFLAQLGLTDQQKQQLKTLMQSHRQQSQGAQQALMSKRQQLRQMIQSGSGSKEQALALHREISQQQSALMASRISLIYDIRAILSPQQFQQFRNAMQQRRGQQGGPGMGMMRPGGMQGGGFPGQRRGALMRSGPQE